MNKKLLNSQLTQHLLTQLLTLSALFDAGLASASPVFLCICDFEVSFPSLFRPSSALPALFLRSAFVQTSYHIHVFTIASPLFLHRFDGQSMDNRWRIDGQPTMEDWTLSERRTDSERRQIGGRTLTS